MRDSDEHVEMAVPFPRGDIKKIVLYSTANDPRPQMIPKMLYTDTFVVTT